MVPENSDRFTSSSNNLRLGEYLIQRAKRHQVARATNRRSIQIGYQASFPPLVWPGPPQYEATQGINAPDQDVNQPEPSVAEAAPESPVSILDRVRHALAEHRAKDESPLSPARRRSTPPMVARQVDTSAASLVELPAPPQPTAAPRVTPRPRLDQSTQVRSPSRVTGSQMAPSPTPSAPRHPGGGIVEEESPDQPGQSKPQLTESNSVSKLPLTPEAESPPETAPGEIEGVKREPPAPSEAVPPSPALIAIPAAVISSSGPKPTLSAKSNPVQRAAEASILAKKPVSNEPEVAPPEPSMGPAPMDEIGPPDRLPGKVSKAIHTHAGAVASSPTPSQTMQRLDEAIAPPEPSAPDELEAMAEELPGLLEVTPGVTPTRRPVVGEVESTVAMPNPTPQSAASTPPVQRAGEVGEGPKPGTSSHVSLATSVSLATTPEMPVQSPQSAPSPDTSASETDFTEEETGFAEEIKTKPEFRVISENESVEGRAFPPILAQRPQVTTDEPTQVTEQPALVKITEPSSTTIDSELLTIEAPSLDMPQIINEDIDQPPPWLQPGSPPQIRLKESPVLETLDRLPPESPTEIIFTDPEPVRPLTSPNFSQFLRRPTGNQLMPTQSPGGELPVSSQQTREIEAIKSVPGRETGIASRPTLPAADTTMTRPKPIVQAKRERGQGIVKHNLSSKPLLPATEPAPITAVSPPGPVVQTRSDPAAGVAALPANTAHSPSTSPDSAATGQAEAEEAKPDFDLEQISRQVYQILRRRLRVEQERTTGR